MAMNVCQTHVKTTGRALMRWVSTLADVHQDSPEIIVKV